MPCPMIGSPARLPLSNGLKLRRTTMAAKTISINRAPVFTLWAAIVAQRLGFDEDEALTLGKAVAGLNAQAKGRRLGIFKPHEEKPAAARKKAQGEEFQVEICGRAVPAKNSADGVRAVHGRQEIDPNTVKKYLASKFGDELPTVRAALEKLARSYSPKKLAQEGYSLYEQFRPRIPAGVRGWGAKGNLDLGLIERLAKKEA